MKLWLISQDVNNNYDTYDSAVVAFETEYEARNAIKFGNYWCSKPEEVEVTYLGEAKPDLLPGQIVASFNAG